MPHHPQRALTRAFPAALALAALALPAAASAAPPKTYCVYTPGGVPCAASGYDGTYTTIFNAMAVAVAGDTIIVEPGTYGEPITVTARPNLTIAGDPAQAERPLVTFDGGGGADTVSQDVGSGGLTLRHLAIEATDDFRTAFAGHASATLADVKLSAKGAGVLTSGGNQIFDHVEVVGGDGTQHPDLVEFSGSGTVVATDMTVNSVNRQIAMDINGPQASFDRLRLTAVTAPSGGADAMQVLGSPDATIAHSTIIGGGFGVVVGGGNLTVTDSLVTAQGLAEPTFAPFGYGPTALFSAVGAALTVRNVTAVARGTNSAGIAAMSDLTVGGSPYLAGSATVTNSIAVGAKADIRVGASNNGGTLGSITVDHTNYRPATGDGVTAGVGNQAADPLFVNGTLGAAQDFRVQAGSPTLRAGVAVPAGTLDLAGAPRPDVPGTLPDLGAYESAFVPPPPPAGPGPAGPGPGTGSPAAPGPFKVVSRKVAKDGKVTYVLAVPGAGRLGATLTTTLPKAKKKAKRAAKKARAVKGKGVRKPKPATYGIRTLSTKAAGTVTVVVSPSLAVRKVLTTGRTLKVTGKLSFTPTGKKATSLTSTFTVKGSKPKKKAAKKASAR